MKKLSSILISLLIGIVALSSIGGCGADIMHDDIVWTNDNAVYAYVRAGFENDILKDVEGAFESLCFQKVYVTEKNVNEWTPLGLLFVIDEDETENQQDFIRLLQQDERINHASACRDIEFETVDTRYIEKEKETIERWRRNQINVKGKY